MDATAKVPRKPDSAKPGAGYWSMTSRPISYSARHRPRARSCSAGLLSQVPAASASADPDLSFSPMRRVLPVLIS
jgi:hypothetical protein